MKRKASKKLPKPAEEEPQIASLVTPIISDGDIQLDFAKDLAQPLGLLVSRHTLCLSSPVFRAMFGDDSPWCESTNKTLNANGTQVVRLEDDNYSSMEIIMNIIHLQGPKVPPAILFPQLDQCAYLCDKYDLGGSLGGWPQIWMKPYLQRVETPGFERWLFISSIFKQDDIVTKVTKHLVLNTTLSDIEGLLYQGSSHWRGGVSSSTLEWIAGMRAIVTCRLLHFCWNERQNACKLRGAPSMDSEAEDCEAVNLGCLSRQFPDLCEPTETSKPDPRSVIEIHEAINNIRHLEEMSGLACPFARRHRACDIGHLIKPKAHGCVRAVQGRRLKPPNLKISLPIWVDYILADLRSSHPNTRLRGAICKTVTSSLTDAVVNVGGASSQYLSEHTELPLPVVQCLDCPENEWIIPGPEKMDSQVEEHVKSRRHLERVGRRLDEAWEEARRREIEENRSLTEERPA